MFIGLYSATKNKTVYINTDYIARFISLGLFGTEIVFSDGSVDEFRVKDSDITRFLKIEVPPLQGFNVTVMAPIEEHHDSPAIEEPNWDEAREYTAKLLKGDLD
jgi:hypothetical protein